MRGMSQGTCQKTLQGKSQGKSMRNGHHHVAILSPGHDAVLQRRRRTQLLDQKQPADEKQQNDRYARETRSLALGRFIVRLVRLPMVMPVHATLHWTVLTLLDNGSAGKPNKGFSVAACFDRHTLEIMEPGRIWVWTACGT
jgi:hypothetical protein